MKLKYKLGKKVKLIGGFEGWITRVQIYADNSVIYTVWDGETKYIDTAPIFITTEQKKKIGFTINF